MAALLTKYSIVPTFKKTGVSLQSFAKGKKEVCHLKLVDIYLQAIKISLQ